MSDYTVIYIVIAALFLLMAYRAFRSASAMDYLLATAQCGGLLLLLTTYRQFALYFLLFTAFTYLLSQILTGAKPISRLLPVAGVVALVVALSGQTSG
jgi:hypothetical protein